jgi:cyclopropane-fatty-acyl-phospholipid synthase
LLHQLASIDHSVIRDLHDRLTVLGMMLMSTVPAELASSESRAYEGALSRCRDVLAAIFGEPEERSFDVKFWDGSVDHGNNPRPPFTMVLNRPAALRRMLLPPNELSIAESYLSGDVEIEGSMEGASNLPDMIGDRLRSPIKIARLVGLVVRLPGKADDDLADARFPERARKLGTRHTPVRDAAAVQFHYDVGNKFYQLWLDQRMVYSCAYFHSASDSLAAR